MGSAARYQDAATLYDSFRAAYAWDAADARDLSIINRVYDDSGKVWFVQPVGETPAVLQHHPGVPELRTFRRLQMPDDDALTSGEQVGVLEWWAGAELVGSQTLVVR
jgi:hypothetical protein